MKGYTGKVLYVNLSTDDIKFEDLNTKWTSQFIGGRGLGARYLYKELQPKIDPLAPENILIFMTGPLTGSDAPATAKYVVLSKSPLTGAFVDSYGGGQFPVEIKFAGFDGMIIKGRARRWSYLSIEDGEAAIVEAEDLVGKGTRKTTEIVKERVGSKDAKVAAIGPAGENQVKFSCITNDLHHQVGRAGIGAVMGSKRLKAIVLRGTNENVEIHDEDAFREAVRDVTRQEILENPDVDWARIDGTPSIVRMSNDAGILPTRNFQDGEFEHVDNIDETAIKEHLLKKTACHRCPIACRNIIKIREGPYKGLILEGPDYETLALAGSNCGIGDLGAIAKYNLLCDDLGIDTITAGNTTAFAMECFERGLLSKEDAGGLDLRFGSVEGYLEIPVLMAHRRGLGATLADGVRAASERIGGGSGRLAVHVKGLEYPGYDPRGSIGMALAYATSDRGACHLRAWPADSEAFGDLDPFTIEGKAALVIDGQNSNSVKWCFIFCDFYPVGYPTMARLYNLATGRGVDAKELELVGERIWNLTRTFNVREGFLRAQDTMPPRMTEPLRSGFAKGKSVSREDFEKMLEEYYELRSWNEDGVPTREKLEELGLLPPD